MAVQTTRLDVGLDPLQRHNLIIQTVHTSKDTRLRFFGVFQKKKVGIFVDQSKNQLWNESFGKEKKPILGFEILEKNNFNTDFQG